MAAAATARAGQTVEEGRARGVAVAVVAMVAAVAAVAVVAMVAVVAAVAMATAGMVRAVEAAVAVVAVAFASKGGSEAAAATAALRPRLAASEAWMEVAGGGSPRGDEVGSCPLADPLAGRRCC